ncbi:FIST N-terminal domain-containing protein [Arenibacterium sp. CAU 1754]
MDQSKRLTDAQYNGATGIVRSASVDYWSENPVETLASALAGPDLELVLLFVSPQADVAAVIETAHDRFAPATVVGCTTAGEIAESGYSEDQILAIGLPRDHFRAETVLVEDLNTFDSRQLIGEIIRNRNNLAAKRPNWPNEFNFLLIDGLSTREDALTSELAVGIGPVQLFGGSAGDGTRFQETFVLYDGKMLTNAAVLIQVRTDCRIKVFKTDHLIPTELRMVVTGADPKKRLVHEINAEPAAREYARILGKDPEQLTTFTFAAHPVVVQIGDKQHVRAIQRVAENGDLVFFSAIDEGLVLTLAEPENMVTHLDRELSALSAPARPDMILACECILRRMEAQEKQVTTALSQLMAKHRVRGFSTYGEQVNSMHVNQTLTGVAIYPPDTDV